MGTGVEQKIYEIAGFVFGISPSALDLNSSTETQPSPLIHEWRSTLLPSVVLISGIWVIIGKTSVLFEVDQKLRIRLDAIVDRCFIDFCTDVGPILY